MQKIIYQFDEKQFNLMLSELKKSIEILNNAVSIKQKYSVDSAEELLESFKDKSGFKNDEIVLTAFNIKEDYQNLLLSESIGKKYITQDKDLFLITSEDLKELKEYCTSYLDEESSKIYNQLENLTNELNLNFSHLRHLQVMNGSYYVNKISLANRKYL